MSKSLHTCAKENFERSCIDTLRENGSRITQPRRLVIQCLAQAERPLSAREVCEEISKESENIDQVSVYRSLDTLKELGLLHQVFPSGGYLACFHSACHSTLHVLTRCVQCENIEEIDVPHSVVAPILDHLKKLHQFFPDEHIFQMNGLCTSCRKE